MTNTTQIVNTFERLRMVRRMIIAMDDDLKQKLNADKMSEFIDKILGNKEKKIPPNMKLIQIIQERFSITSESGDAQQYFDRITSDTEDHKYDYNPQLEQQLLGIDLKLDEFMALTVKYMDVEEGIDLNKLMPRKN